MSTSDESGRQEGCDRIAIPPEWEARAALEPLRAVAVVPPERRDWVRRALGGVVGEIEFVKTPADVLAADADILVLSNELVSAGGDPGTEDPGPVRVVIDAPEDARIAWLTHGADLATGCGISADEAAAQIEALARRAQMERDRSPLTGLPGNRRLRRHLRRRLAHGEVVAVVMADIDDFKGYNDRCGHLAGDELILALAEVLREVTEVDAGFLAHVGGDDFAVVCDPGGAEALAGTVEREFGRRQEAAGVEPPEITIVSTMVTPDEADDLRGAFERLAEARGEARKARDRRSYG